MIDAEQQVETEKKINPVKQKILELNEEFQSRLDSSKNSLGVKIISLWGAPDYKVQRLIEKMNFGPYRKHIYREDMESILQDIEELKSNFESIVKINETALNLFVEKIKYENLDEDLELMERKIKVLERLKTPHEKNIDFIRGKNWGGAKVKGNIQVLKEKINTETYKMLQIVNEITKMLGIIEEMSDEFENINWLFIGNQKEGIVGIFDRMHDVVAKEIKKNTVITKQDEISFELDNIDIEMLNLIKDDKFSRDKAIRALGIGETNVRNRYKRLKQAGYIDVKETLHPESGYVIKKTILTKKGEGELSKGN